MCAAIRHESSPVVRHVFFFVISVSSGSHVFSSVSVTSDRSKEEPPERFSEKKTSPNKR